MEVEDLFLKGSKEMGIKKTVSTCEIIGKAMSDNHEFNKIERKKFKFWVHGAIVNPYPAPLPSDRKYRSSHM